MKTNRIKTASRVSCLAAASVLFFAFAAPAADVERGRALHDTHCRMCHTSAAYKRDSKVGHTYEDVRAEVVRWQKNSSLRWSEDDIDSVTSYLAKTYYGLPCPSC
jgi:mono/diheme cytochrome c family protein